MAAPQALSDWGDSRMAAEDSQPPLDSAAGRYRTSSRRQIKKGNPRGLVIGSMQGRGRGLAPLGRGLSAASQGGLSQRICYIHASQPPWSVIRRRGNTKGTSLPRISHCPVIMAFRRRFDEQTNGTERLLSE